MDNLHKEADSVLITVCFIFYILPIRATAIPEQELKLKVPNEFDKL